MIGTSWGQYYGADSDVKPVPFYKIKGAEGNSFFGKLSTSNQEGIHLGDLDAGTGLTLEGWFYPTGTDDEFAASNFISKSDTFQPGSFWLRAHRMEGRLNFGVKDDAGTWHSGRGRATE